MGKNKHHLVHDRARRGVGILDLTSQTDLRRIPVDTLL